MTSRPVPPEMADRYGTGSTWRRRAVAGGAAVVVLVFLGWLGWAIWFHSTPDVDSELVGYDVAGEHELSVVVQVDLAAGAEATCRVRAYAEDHHTVGDVAFTPVDGRNELVVRTERLATTVDLLGCTTPDQPRPR